MQSNGFDSLETVSKLLLSNGTAGRFAFAQIAGATTVNAIYSAYNFYQSRQDEPLTKEEMEEIHDGVVHEVMELCQTFLNNFSEVAQNVISPEE